MTIFVHANGFRNNNWLNLIFMYDDQVYVLHLSGKNPSKL
jgi:hypothetical protein